MTGATISRETGTRLASYIEVRRRELVASVVRSAVLPRPDSIAASAFADGFLERLCQETEIGDRDIVGVWLDAQHDGGDGFEQSLIVVLACVNIAAAYVRDCGDCDEIVTFLALRAGELEKRFRSERPKAAALVDAAKLVGKDEIVSALLSAIEARDVATCGHSRAVGMWCGRIAKTMGMHYEQQQAAALAGTLHDVGKIATPSEILLKPGPLVPGEWATMRQHSRIGAQMLERIPSLRDLAPIVRAHHERMDGRGYPDGIAGNHIPLLARIVAVADSFHAMISKRPYRSAMTVPAALDELRAGAGAQWDASLVEAMLDIVQPATVHRPLHAVRIAR